MGRVRPGNRRLHRHYQGAVIAPCPPSPGACLPLSARPSYLLCCRRRLTKVLTGLQWRKWYFGHTGTVQWHSLYNRYDVFLAALPPASPFHQPLPPTPVENQQVQDILKELADKMEQSGVIGATMISDGRQGPEAGNTRKRGGVSFGRGCRQSWRRIPTATCSC